MQKIIPHLWFDTQAQEAAQFYVSVFPGAKITSTTTLHDTPSGDSDIVAFTLAGHDFMAISAGPYFKINPSISFILNFDPSQDQQAGVVGEKVDERLYRMHVETTYLVQTDEQSYRVKSGSTLPEGSSLTFWALDGSDEGSSSAFSYDMFFGLVMVIAGIGLPIKYYRVTHKKTTPRV